MISSQVIIVFTVIVFLLLSLYREWFRPSISFLVAVIALTVLGVLSPAEALSGFANEQLAVIVLLLVFSNIIQKTSVIDVLFEKLFLRVKSVKGFMWRMMLYVSTSSAFFNNTPLVAMMMPYVYNWSKKNKLSPSRLLMPLSYAAILGGCATLVGTSTNLIVNGLAVDAGFPSLDIFDFVYAGVPMLLIGGIYIMLFSNKLLPDHKDFVDEFMETSREYFVETHVRPDSKLVGKTVTEADLRQMEELFLVEIIRGNKSITPVSPAEILEANDRLIFAGATGAVEEIASSANGLSLPKECDIPEHDKAGLIEIVISYNSWLIDKKIKNTDFRGKYDGAVVAVHRNGERISGKIGDVELQAGDVLLVLAGKDFFKRVAGNQAFYVIAEKEKAHAVDVKKAAVIFAGILTAVVLSALNVVPLFQSLICLLAIVLFMNVIPLAEIRKGLDFNLIILLALGLTLGKAMINSGAAALIADHLVIWGKPFGVVIMMAGIFLLTNMLSAYITNKAAVAIFFPISVAVADSFNLDPTPFILIVAYGAAANFITPIGYQTNLMVYGPGAYTFKDFFKFGLPLTLIYMIVAVFILALKFEFI